MIHDVLVNFLEQHHAPPERTDSEGMRQKKK